MDLKELYTELEAVENGGALVDGLKGIIASLNAESKTHREAKETLEKEANELRQKVETLTASSSSSPEYKALEMKFEEMKETLEAEKVARKEADDKRIHSEMLAQTVDALTKHNALDPKEMASLLMPNISVKEDGSYMYKGKDGKDVSILDGAKSWLDDHTWAIRDMQKPGSGAGNQGQNSGNKPLSLSDAIAKTLGQEN